MLPLSLLLVGIIGLVSYCGFSLTRLSPNVKLTAFIDLGSVIACLAGFLLMYHAPEANLETLISWSWYPLAFLALAEIARKVSWTKNQRGGYFAGTAAGIMIAYAFGLLKNPSLLIMLSSPFTKGVLAFFLVSLLHITARYGKEVVLYSVCASLLPVTLIWTYDQLPVVFPSSASALYSMQTFFICVLYTMTFAWQSSIVKQLFEKQNMLGVLKSTLTSIVFYTITVFAITRVLQIEPVIYSYALFIFIAVCECYSCKYSLYKNTECADSRLIQLIFGCLVIVCSFALYQALLSMGISVDIGILIYFFLFYDVFSRKHQEMGTQKPQVLLMDDLAAA